MNLIIRGHIRNALKSNSLYRLVREISAQWPIKIYIHTWNVAQTSLSWRQMRDDSTIVSETMVINYFRELSGLIDTVIVEDDKNVCLEGDVKGKIASTPCPVKGYKYMFYGMMRAAEAVAEKAAPDELVVQTRFDVYSNWVSFSNKQILQFMSQKPAEWERIRFLVRPGESREELENRLERWKRWGAEYEPHWTVGIDNTYMARVADMRDFLQHMFHNLDRINAKYPKVQHQEWLTAFEAFNPEWMKPS